MTTPESAAAPAGTVGAVVGRISRQDLNAAMISGQEACRDGVKVGDNPWPDTDERHFRWMEGWAAFGLRRGRPRFDMSVIHLANTGREGTGNP